MKENINVKDLDILGYMDNDLLSIFTYKNIVTINDVFNCTKLLSNPKPTSHTEEFYQGFRDLVLYRYYGIPKDNSRYLNSRIIFGDDGRPITVEGEEIHMCSILHRLGLNGWDDQTVRWFAKINHYQEMEYVDLEKVFNDMLTCDSLTHNPNRKVVQTLVRRIGLILESNNKAKEQNINKGPSR